MLSSIKAITVILLTAFIFFSTSTNSFAKTININDDKQVEAANSVINFSKLNSYSINNLDISFGPTVLTKYKGLMVKTLKDSIFFWSSMVGEIKFKVVAFTEKDIAWLKKIKQKYGGDFNVEEQMRGVTDNCNWAIATKTFNHVPIIYFCSSSKQINISDLQSIPHEYYHIVQFFKNGISSTPLAPCWILEGSATYFGIAIGMYGNDKKHYKKSSRIFISSLLAHSDLGFNNAKKIIMRQNKKEVIQKIILPAQQTQSETKNGCYSAASYYVGSLMTEYLIVNYGIQNFVKLSLLDFNSVDWKKEFANIYGLPLDSFYENVVTYMAEQTY